MLCIIIYYMKNFDKINFLGTFRNYQQRVLDRSYQYLKNNKIHIVAAPGSGKTILGLELIRRINSPCLVLSPTNTIKFQWGDRFEEMFLPKGQKVDNYVSFDLKQIRPITSITYQALHSAINKVICKDEDGEIIDYTDIDLLNTLKIYDIKTICVDEAHHLQNEWQKALEKFMASIGSDIKVIALTATPPYDASPTEWERYINICGEIDEEIFVTELVKAKNLCPHQDYVYLNYPTQEETQYFKLHMTKVDECLNQLKDFVPFIDLGNSILNHRASEFIIKESQMFLSIFGLLKYLDMSCDYKKLKKILNVNDIDSSLSAVENGLNVLISNEYILSEKERNNLKSILKKCSLIEKNEVRILLNNKLDNIMMASLGKLESITKIVDSEFTAMQSNLRMLVLTDYIRKKDLSKIGTNVLFDDISVVSIFETIRRKFPDQQIGLLSGTLAIFPTDIKDKVLEHLGNKKSLSLKQLGNTGYSEYIFNVNNKEKVRIVGKIFEDGLINVLVGTKSLLGEGWDSPCINSLILASFVGSFMLSNQMRGRAIRTYKKDPNKTANIWHLVTLNPAFKSDSILMNEYTSNDYKTLKRRFNSFVGPHYSQNSIQNGINRISILKEVMTEEDISSINNEMLTRSNNRSKMSDQWYKSNIKSGQLYIETSIPKERITNALGIFSIPNAILNVLLMLAFISLSKIAGKILAIPLTMIAIYFIIASSVYLVKILILSSRGMFVSMVSHAIKSTMMLYDLLKVKSRVKVKYNIRNKTYDVIIISNSMKDQQKFSQSLTEFFMLSKDARYVLIKKFYYKPLYRYSFVVPKELAKNHRMAYVFSLYLLLTKNNTLVYVKNNRNVITQCSIYNYFNFCCRPITKRQNSV